MVIESLINPIKAEKKPWVTFFLGIIYSSAAMIIGLLIFPKFSSIIIVALTAMVAVPFFYSAIKMEEKEDLQIDDEKAILKEHGKVLSCFLFMFFGFVVSFSLWYIFLPVDIANQTFDIQINEISEINSPVTGNLFEITSSLEKIYINNFKVLFFCLIFAFFYGYGAIFIIAWNASILATVIGSVIKTNANMLLIAPIVLLKYSLHGLPEIAAYLIVGLAGGIISIAVIRHDFGTEKYKNILKDSLDLIIIGAVLILIAGLIEVFISPKIL